MAAIDHGRCPIQCIIPPYMTDHMVEHGDEETRRRSLELLAESSNIRGQREVRASIPQVSTRALTIGRKQISIFDAQGQRSTTSRVRRKTESDPDTGDAAVDDTYRGLDAAYECFLQHYQRRSFDDRGMLIDATVNYGQDFGNAFWDGEKLVFGNGNGKQFNRFSVARDIIAHEYTHGVIQHSAKLVYQGQSGALNESLADVFGILVKHFSDGTTVSESDPENDDSKWLIGVGILMPSVSGRALRSMLRPGTAYQDPVLGVDPQPDHMSGYKKTDADKGGVHINSGIPNRAFALTARAIGGKAWERPGEIWYQAMLQLKSDAQFVDFANATERYAGEKFGFSSKEFGAVAAAWSQVGVKPSRQLAGTRSLGSAVGADADFDAIIQRVAEQLGKKLVEVVAAELRRDGALQLREGEAAYKPVISKKKKVAAKKQSPAEPVPTPKRKTKKRTAKKNS
jgi:Zn-dependent metalloprotease